MIAYLFTTFPKASEQFLQREVEALRAQDVPLRIYSMWGGSARFRGMEVRRFRLWRLVTLLWLIPYEGGRRPDVFKGLVRGVLSRRPPTWINFWENLLGAAFACVYAREFRRERPTLIHAAWSGGPATAAWILGRLDGHGFSAGAHAYDVFEGGGDWWLMEKLADARFVHTSTSLARSSLLARGLDGGKVVCIRSGLDWMPALKPLRSLRLPLNLACVARLVEKKGIERQLRIYAELRSAGVPFTARIVGDGPLRRRLEDMAGRLGVADVVTFCGEVPSHEVWEHLAWADALLHTGVIARNGDRDGLPNVIGEAMAAGAVVLTSPVAGTTEAVQHGVTGLVLETDEPAAWVEALRRLAADDAFAEAMRQGARAWVEAFFEVNANTRRLLERLRAAETAVPAPVGRQDAGSPGPSASADPDRGGDRTGDAAGAGEPAGHDPL